MGYGRKWTNKEKEYISKITPGNHYKEIKELMYKKFNQQYTIEQIKAAIGRYKLNTGFNGQYRKGNKPVNKGTKGLTVANRTSFKKGNIPPNYVPVGSERINGDDYVDIKIADTNKWKGKHILIWEKYNGPVPKGHVVIFGDRNNRNFDINNLILISRKQLLILNRNKLIQNDANLTRTAVMIADLYQKISDKKNSQRR